MAIFKLVPSGVQRTMEPLTPELFGKITSTPGSLIPPDTTNTRWNEYLAWVDAGGVPDPADKPPTDAADHTFAGGFTWN